MLSLVVLSTFIKISVKKFSERKHGLFGTGLLTQWRVDVKFKVFSRFWRSGLRRIKHGSLGTAARVNVAGARHETVT